MPLIWPLLDKLRSPPVASQRRPASAGGRGLARLPTLPWDDGDRPGVPGYGQVESDPTVAEFMPLNFGLAAVGKQAVRLQDLKTNPRALPVSEQRREPAPVRPPGLWQVTPTPPPPRDDGQTSRIIWPLRLKFLDPRSVARHAPVNATPQVHGLVSVQQNPKARPQRNPPPILPWDRVGPLAMPSVVRMPKAFARTASIAGVTRDGNGAVLGGCAVELYETATNIALMRTTSDPTTGAFLFTCARYTPATHYIVAYKPGSPDVAGTTLNTLDAGPDDYLGP